MRGNANTVFFCAEGCEKFHESPYCTQYGNQISMAVGTNGVWLDKRSGYLDEQPAQAALGLALQVLLKN